MNEKHHRYLYQFFDLISSFLSWWVFLIFVNQTYPSPDFGNINFNVISNYNLIEFIFVFLFWLSFYFLQGIYQDNFRKSRLQELAKTIIASFLGTLFILLIYLEIEKILYAGNIYNLYLIYLFAHFVFTYFPRFLITNFTIHKIRSGKIYFNTLLAGSNGKALAIYNELISMPKSHGNNIIGFISISTPPTKELMNRLNFLGDSNQLEDIINKFEIKEIILATENKENELIGQIIAIATRKNVKLKIIPDIYDYLIGRVKLSHLYDIPLIEINQDLIPNWQIHFKRLLDFAFSIFALIALSPVFLLTAIAIKLNSKGPVFYSHERIGRLGKAFTIYKFRSMYTDAEKNGPQLAAIDDIRITKVGKFLRKSRLDEIPQFYNVLIGDMSLVGPRPERQYYIELIIKKAPHYQKLQRIKPGITSWGQVKYGYADTVEQMIERLNYDILYLDNMSLYTDVKILIYTLYIVLKADGR